MPKFKTSMLNGHPGNITRACKNAIARGVSHGLVVTATTDGVHAATSWHTPARRAPLFLLRGRAVDMGTRPGVSHHEARKRKIAFQRAELARGVEKYRELLGPEDRSCILNGRRVKLTNDTVLENAHDTHTHVAPKR